jgi:putative transposase
MLIHEIYAASGGECHPKGFKAEVIHRRGAWRSFEAVEFATLEWVDWFNHRRLLEPIGNIPPAEAEARYYAMPEEPAMAA